MWERQWEEVALESGTVRPGTYRETKKEREREKWFLVEDKEIKGYFVLKIKQKKMLKNSEG